MSTLTPSFDFVSIKSNVSFFEYLLALLSGEMDRPTLYGWYHLLCLATVVGLCAFIFFKARNLSDKQVDLILGLTATGLLVLEIYKQLVFSYDAGNDTWRYHWYAFPFQFCSTPMYVMLAAALVKNKKVKDSLYAFMATYGLFAGAAVMFYPGDVFIETIGINVQTMIHHGGMVVIGFFMYVSGRAKLSHKTILKALPVFCILVTVAMGLNILYHFFGDPEQTFNMFYISPYYPCTLPVLSMFYGKVPYILFLMLYVGGFTLAGYIMSLFGMGVYKLHHVIKQKISPENQNGQISIS